MCFVRYATFRNFFANDFVLKYLFSVLNIKGNDHKLSMRARSASSIP